MKYNYPECRRSDLVEDYFGHKLEAPYTWLRNTKDPEVLDFTARENAFTDAWFDKDEVEAMKAKLKAEHVPEPMMRLSPWRDGYLASESKDGNSSVVELDSSMNKVRTLFARYDLPERTSFAADACPTDENLLAILTMVDAAPRPDIVIYDFEKKENLAVLPMTFSGSWSKKRRSYYSPATKVEGESSLTTIQRWDADTGEVAEILTYPENSIFGEISRSEDGSCFIFCFSMNYSEHIFYSYEEESGQLTCLNEGCPLELIYVDSTADGHYFISLKESDHGTLIVIPRGGTIADARTVYEEKDGYMDSGFSAGGKLFVHVQSCAASAVKIVPDGTPVALPEPVCAIAPCGEGRGVKFFSFDSFTSSPVILKFDGEKFETAQGTPADGSEMVAELLFAESGADGAKIPYYLVRRKDAEKDGNHRTLMYGYGGYNINMPPWSTEMVSQTNIRSWVLSGGIYVHCLLRGGNEYGPAWHLAGMGMNKKNCYGDFIGIAEKIIADGWTVPAKIVISGCSNGGLLMSALVTMRPDLWGCVIDSVPHTDMIHFADDDRGAMYITEYGDPHRSEEEFLYLKSYSPVHNVRAVDYPPVYIQTGECDNNVPPYHGKSFAATMQSMNTSDNPILLRVLEKGSHDRGQGEVFWQTIAEMRVFMEKALG